MKKLIIATIAAVGLLLGSSAIASAHDRYDQSGSYDELTNITDADGTQGNFDKDGTQGTFDNDGLQAADVRNSSMAVPGPVT